ncbi:MAG TPA: hypothetical protein VFX43_14640 [Chitinophagaceae bacterium]|jgi:hypothetical protein|nr:hypothetical protein [Chitinophagaceae bacterium]
MLPADNKNDLKTKEVNQQVIAISETTDFNSSSVLKEIERVNQEIKSVMEGAIVNPEKLGFNFTV